MKFINFKSRTTDNTMSNDNRSSNGLIPDNLYAEIPQFVDKRTLLEYMKAVDGDSGPLAKELKQCYDKKLKPFEEFYNFSTFHEPPLDDAFFYSKPIILLIGQYSSGKSTFVRYLIDKDYPGIRIGPEPTTDKFVAVMYNEESAIIPGNALVIDGGKPFKPLIKFGNKFLNRFQASMVDSPVLKGITVIDSPGILTDNNNSDGYDYKGVIEWFSARADRIFLFVDANKLELSGDFQQIVQMIRQYDDKLRIVLNKTDMVDEQGLIRIYGALMWFLGQTLEMKEVAQIYIGSFWGQPVRNETNRRLYEFEEYRIFEDLANLPKESLLRKANYLVKRAQEISIHVYISSSLREQYRKVMIRYFLKQRTKRKFLKKLPKIYDKIEKERNCSRNDFPEMDQIKQELIQLEWDNFRKYSSSMFKELDSFINVDIPPLVTKTNDQRMLRIFKIDDNPFEFERGVGFDDGSLDSPKTWIVSKHRKQFEDAYHELKGNNLKVPASKAKAHMLKSSLPSKVLHKIWTLSDVDRDGELDEDEFLLAMYLISVKKQNFEVPNELPKHLIPPSKRNGKNEYY